MDLVLNYTKKYSIVYLFIFFTSLLSTLHPSLFGGNQIGVSINRDSPQIVNKIDISDSHHHAAVKILQINHMRLIVSVSSNWTILL